VNVDKTASAENANITLTNSYLAAGEGVELAGGEYTLTNSAIIAGNDEKSSDVVISDSTLNLTDSVITGNNITLKNNTLNADKSDIVADQDIVFDGGEYTWTDSESTILSLNGNITVKSGNFYGDGDFVTPNGDVNIEGGYVADDADDVNNGNWGDPDSDHLDIENKNLNIKGGTVEFNNTNTTSAINNNISGGKVILNSGAITSWIGNINVSGGEIDISGNTEEAGHDIGLYARQELNISDGTININGEGITIDNIADIFEDDYDTYDLNISGGTINVSGGTSEINEIASSKNINFTGGTINVNENSALGFAGGNDQIAATVITGKDAVLNISGKVDLGLGSAVGENDKPVDDKKGTLSGNGTINFLTSSANLNGNVSGVALAFETDNTLSTAITGTIEDAILNVNQGTLAVDKAASLNNLTVAENAGLTVKNAISTKTFTSSGTIIGNSNSDITASGDLTVNGGSVNNDNSDLESWKTITIANTDVQLNNAADLTALEKLVIKDSQITAKNDVELWSLGDIEISGSTLDLTDSSINTLYENLDDIYAGQVSEPDTAGNITVSNTTLSLKNSNLESAGDIKLSSDTLNIDTAGTLAAAGNITAENTEFNISEDAELSLLNTQEEASTLALNGGSINLLGTINGSLNGNTAINVLNSTNKIAGNVTLTDGGEMNIGTNKATIDGDAIFNSGSTVKMTVNSADEYGSLKANSVTGKEGAKLSLTVDNSIRDKITVKLFDTESMSDNFTREISNNRYTVTSDDGQSYDIEYTASASDIVADAGGTENNAQTAEAWDTIANDSHVSQGAKDVAHHLNDLSQHDAKKYNDALTALAPDAAPSVSHTSQQNTQQIFSAVGNRFNGGHMSGGHMGGPRGMSSGDVAGQRAAAWVQGLYNKAKLDDTSSSKGFDSKSYGTALGLETQYTDDVKLGIGYAYTKTDIDGFMRDTDVKTHTAILYGEYKPNNWYVNGVASYGWSDYSEDKNVSGMKVTADYDAETLGLQAITGYDIYLNNVTLSPEAGLRYVHVEQDRYTDSAGQSVSTDDSDILTGVIGVKAGTSYNYDSNVILKPEVRLAATYDLNNSDANSIVTLANGSGYKVNGDSLDRFGIETGVSVTANINEAIDVSLGYEGKFREDYQDHTGLINFKYNF
jgi:outer membrane autotransporter protein